MDLQGFLFSTLLVVVQVLGVLAAYYIKKKAGVEGVRKINEELKSKKTLAEEAVQFAEQVFKDLHGEDKFNKAAEWMSTELSKRGLGATPEEVKGLIESAIRGFKDTFGEEWAKPNS